MGETTSKKGGLSRGICEYEGKNEWNMRTMKKEDCVHGKAKISVMFIHLQGDPEGERVSREILRTPL